MVTGRRRKFRSVTPIVFPTAVASWANSLQDYARLPGTAPALVGDDERRGEQERERHGQEELPGDRQDLVDPDPNEAPAHPRHQQEHRQRFQREPDRAQPTRARTEPAPEEQ